MPSTPRTEVANHPALETTDVMLKSLEILGLRGFRTNQTLMLAMPDGRPGSGLTVIVGANNSGKSTAIEALNALIQMQSPSFSMGRRNNAAGDMVIIKANDSDEHYTTIKTIRSGSSETEWASDCARNNVRNILVLQARRSFNPYFYREYADRQSYVAQIGFPPIRTSSLDSFTRRLFTIEKNREEFNTVLGKVLDPLIDWSIDMTDNGMYFMNIRKDVVSHSSDGMGEGLVSLMYIIDAIYDSKDKDLIAIDEPELSLHPALQRKLSDLLVEYAANRQIVIATHSPHFVSLDALPNGATIARTHLEDGGSQISQLSSSMASKIFKLMANENNPHILGLLAKEILFAEDKIILVEGQEDVVFLKKVEAATEHLEGTLFGWGVGGADNMMYIATVLYDLGFKKVVGILDANKSSVADTLRNKFKEYHFFTIPANDIRTKPKIAEKAATKGLLNDENEAMRPEYVDEVKNLFQKANLYLRS